MWMTHVKPGRAVSPLISLSPKILTFPPPQLHLVRLTLWTLSLTQTNSYKKSSTLVTHPDHNLHIPVLIFAKIWVLTSAVIFPDHFVVFDNVAQIFLIKTLNCHENHLSWSYSSFSHSLLLSCMRFFFLPLKLLLLQFLSLPTALLIQYVFLGDSHSLRNSQFKWIEIRWAAISFEVH